MWGDEVSASVPEKGFGRGGSACPPQTAGLGVQRSGRAATSTTAQTSTLGCSRHAVSRCLLAFLIPQNGLGMVICEPNPTTLRARPLETQTPGLIW